MEFQYLGFHKYRFPELSIVTIFCCVPFIKINETVLEIFPCEKVGITCGRYISGTVRESFFRDQYGHLHYHISKNHQHRAGSFRVLRGRPESGQTDRRFFFQICSGG